MMVHKPSPELLATLTPTDYQILQILQTEEHLSQHLDQLRMLWRPSTIIHGDIKSDNVLGIGSASTELGVRLVDWELCQIGDPAWDVAAAFQDIIMFWIYSMPISAQASAHEMVQKAAFPLDKIQAGLRAMWEGYRTRARLASTEVVDLLSRAIRFSGARLIQRAYEVAHGSPALPAYSVLLLQCAANVMNDPESAQIQLYGIPAERRGL
jgi:aminoglycoside phosphotransferase (APT) family kinase protein